ncbi:MAG: hypothetical protein HY922_13250 [Elusimicrobia bacterium]|nr:hypothetical protein [Elusimicrobiota bacterium]
MFCPKCLGETPDDKNKCVNCGEILFFKKPASLLGRHKVYPEAGMSFDSWILKGPAVLSDNGLHFFLLSCKNTRAERVSDIAENIAEGIGMGAILGGAMGSAASAAFGEDASRPKEFLFRKVELVPWSRRRRPRSRRPSGRTPPGRTWPRRRAS